MTVPCIGKVGLFPPVTITDTGEVGTSVQAALFTFLLFYFFTFKSPFLTFNSFFLFVIERCVALSP